MSSISSIGSGSAALAAPRSLRSSSAQAVTTETPPLPESSSDAATVTISKESRDALTESSDTATEQTSDNDVQKAEQAQEREEQALIRELKARDAEVKAHEQAHLSALGPYKSGGPSYSYQTGPDGRRYAVGGEVPVDLSSESKPQETIQKMQVIQRAALAPAGPSSADRAVASQAAQIEAQARAELQKENQEGEQPTESSSDPLSGEEQVSSESKSVEKRADSPSETKRKSAKGAYERAGSSGQSSVNTLAVA